MMRGTTGEGNSLKHYFLSAFIFHHSFRMNGERRLSNELTGGAETSPSKETTKPGEETGSSKELTTDGRDTEYYPKKQRKLEEDTTSPSKELTEGGGDNGALKRNNEAWRIQKGHQIT